jgi:hypothetical protein
MQNKYGKKEILYGLENRLLQQEIRSNKKAVEALLSDDFVEFGASGTIYNKETVIESLQAESKIKFTITDFDVKEISSAAVLVTYRSMKKDENTNECTFTLRSSVWKVKDNRWQLFFHQGTPVKY